MSGPLLQIRGLEAAYGNVVALRGVDLDVGEGEIVTLIGANGAGKSTLMMTICGNPRAKSGSITFAGRDISNLPTHEIMHLSIAQAPEGRRIFPRMTVLENLQMGAVLCREETFDEDLAQVYELFPVLAKRADQRGGTLRAGAGGREPASRWRNRLLPSHTSTWWVRRMTESAHRACLKLHCS